VIAAKGSYQHGAFGALSARSGWCPRLSASQHFNKSSESLAKSVEPDRLRQQSLVR
jgi:hypothetical protein